MLRTSCRATCYHIQSQREFSEATDEGLNEPFSEKGNFNSSNSVGVDDLVDIGAEVDGGHDSIVVESVTMRYDE